MIQEQRQRRGREPDATVYPEGHLGSVLYGKRPRMLHNDSIGDISPKRRGRGVLRAVGRVLAFPFRAPAAAIKRLRRRKDSQPEGIRLAPYYRPPIRTGDAAHAFEATGIPADAGQGKALRKKSTLSFRHRPKTLREEIFKPHKTPAATKLKVAAAALSILLIAGAVGYGGWWYIEGRYSIVTINDNGIITQVRTADETVADVLMAGGVQLGDNDRLSMHPATEVHDGLNVGIVRAKDVTISTKDGDVEVALAEGTVQDALTRAEIAFDEDDEISPSLDTELTDGLQISKVDVQVQYETTKEEIPFNTVEQDSNSILKGKTEVRSEGANGEKSIKERVIVKDGEEAERDIIATNVDLAPVDRVVLNGTKEEVRPVQLPSAKAAAAPAGGGEVASSKPAPAGGPSADQIASEMTVDFITAYTHTGNKTSTGVWPARGTCAVNPSKIPYGTRMYIPGYGYATAQDTGSFTRGRNALDVFMESEGECRSWGRKYSVTVYILK